MRSEVREVLRHNAAYDEVVAYIRDRLESFGNNVKLQKFETTGKIGTNVVGMVKGQDRTLEPLRVGAHFDTREDTP